MCRKVNWLRPGAGGLPFQPYGIGLQVPNVFVDGLRSPETVLELSHWPGNRTPQAYRSDVSTQAVFKFLEDPAQGKFRGAEAVTCDHYDVDGLLSVWALVRPQEAQDRASLVIDAATSGDFDIWTSSAGVRACLALHQLEVTVAKSDVFRSAVSTAESTELLFSTMLNEVLECLEHPERVPGWGREWHDILESLRWLDCGRAFVEEYAEYDLAILRSEIPLHPFAVNARTQRLLVAETTPENAHRLRFRYESFVDMQSRPAVPRIRGDLLAAELRNLEPSGWICEPPDTATPCLQRYGPTVVPAPSRLSFDRFVKCVVDFCQQASSQPDLLWHSDASWHKTTGVRPPSGGTL